MSEWYHDIFIVKSKSTYYSKPVARKFVKFASFHEKESITDVFL